jgi:CBS domain-containing protein
MTMKVADLMTRGVLSVAPEDSVRKAAELMLRYGVTGFPVLDHGKLVGMITEGDFLRRIETDAECRHSRLAEFFADPGKLADEYVHSHGRMVAEVMTRDVVTISDNAPLSDAVEAMMRHHVKRLPVVREGALIGVISRVDLLHAFLTATSKTAPAALDDAAIKSRLQSEFDKQPWAAAGSVELVVESGVVVLRGTIRDPRQRTAMRVAVENVPGVKRVVDELREIDLSLCS